MGGDTLLLCILKVVDVVLRKLLLISISVDGGRVLSGKLPGHSCFSAAAHLYFKTLANVAVNIGAVQRKPISHQLKWIMCHSLGLPCQTVW